MLINVYKSRDPICVPSSLTALPFHLASIALSLPSIMPITRKRMPNMDGIVPSRTESLLGIGTTRLFASLRSKWYEFDRVHFAVRIGVGATFSSLNDGTIQLQIFQAGIEISQSSKRAGSD